MTPFCEAIVDPANSLVHIIVSGFFTPEDVDRFIAKRDAAHLLLRCAKNDHVTLVDMRAMEIQSRETVARFQHAMSSSHARSRRLAFVVSKTLARMQIERAATGRDAMFFTDLAEARAYLLSKEALAA